jgi:transposase
MRGGAAADRRSNETSKRLDGTGHRPWFTALLARRSTKVAAVALANKIARMASAMMARGERYRKHIALAA